MGVVLLLVLLALQAFAGCSADALTSGSYRLRLPGRLACASQGLLSSFACTSGNTRLTLLNRQPASTEWSLQPVQPTAKSIAATTLVRLVATSRTACGTTGGPKSNVTATAVEVSRWGLGYEGGFRLVNNNTYDILNWRLDFTFAGGNFTWGPSDGDVTWQGMAGQLVPKQWSQEIKAGATKEIRFGGSGPLPTNLQFIQVLSLLDSDNDPSQILSTSAPRVFSMPQFTQVLPLLDPDNDPSLKTRGAFPAKVFAPFVDVGLYPTPRLLDFFEATGQQWFTLAFITADQERKVPAWAGTIGLEKQFLMDQIRDVRLRGGDVIVSFGGAAGQELAQVVTDENALLAHYQAVIDLYKLRWVDFDVEGQAVAQPASYDRRNRVLARLQAANPGLIVSFTLPVLPTGLTADGVRLLESCAKYRVRVDVVNIMTMDYGDSAAPAPDGRMGDYAIQAAEATYRQALAAGLNATKIGNTPMIGRNDVETEVFYQADAHKVGRGRWFNGETYVSIQSSSIPQQPFEFTKIFKQYAG
ncbi:hypothetical protein COHA_009555 [Chlorella ohadii]|uniref:CBM2 domain-containing protein n=1 Tax=Chlorella ohadii TaxID=2649997 RepID=A0AAD5DEH9_9CHLO|nr:hypothetical protein COHA_009555 [Chlorella ohadii]